jgi:hypothetical protein
MMLSSGEQVLTVSGRVTAPFPRVDVTTDRRTANTLRRVEAWLIGAATAEAAHRRDQWTLTHLTQISLRNLSQSDKDTAELYLFGEGPVRA